MSGRQPLSQRTSLVQRGRSSKFCSTVKFQVCIRNEPWLVQNLGCCAPWIAATSLTAIDDLLPVDRLALHPVPVCTDLVNPGLHYKRPGRHVGVEPLRRISSHNCNRSRAEPIWRQFEIETPLVRPCGNPRLCPGKLCPGGIGVLEANAVPCRSLGPPSYPHPLTRLAAIRIVRGKERRLPPRSTFLDRQNTVTHTVSQRLQIIRMLIYKIKNNDRPQYFRSPFFFLQF